MSEVGARLKSVRNAKRLSLRKFAKEIGQDYTLLARIEKGERFPPKGSLRKFAQLLALTPDQLDALIGVERRELNPHEMLPEIPPAHRTVESIEKAAERLRGEYRAKMKFRETSGRVPVEKVVKVACDLSIKYRDFASSDALRGRPDANLYGCLFPEGYQGKDRVILVNSGHPNGQRLSDAERRITIAHEAGHYVLHCTNQDSPQRCFRFTKGPTFCREVECQDKPLDLREYQATAFAACLLMPREEFAKEYAPGSEARVATHFGVTESLVQFRAELIELGITRGQ